jgi:hypothetical protein
MTVNQVNFYRVGNRWAYSAWTGSECDHCDMLDAETAAEARAEVEALFPAAQILRLGDEDET